MLYTTDPQERDYFITALRQLAGYLETHPAVPVPTGTTFISLYAETTEDGGREQVNHIARLLGAPVSDEIAAGGHYTAARFFGPIDYQAVSIPASYDAWSEAQNSYRGCITTETGPADLDT